jgi:hypothetical protein
MNRADAIVTAMEHDWPDYQIWVVHRYIGGPVWCARPWNGQGQTLNAASPDELADQIEQEQEMEQEQ